GVAARALRAIGVHGEREAVSGRHGTPAEREVLHASADRSGWIDTIRRTLNDVEIVRDHVFLGLQDEAAALPRGGAVKLGGVLEASLQSRPVDLHDDELVFVWVQPVHLPDEDRALRPALEEIGRAP